MTTPNRSNERDGSTVRGRRWGWWSRRRFIAGSIAGVLGGLGYSHWVEPGWLAVRRIRVPINRAAGGRPIRLLHLSDFHASDSVTLAFIAKAVQLGLTAKPDLICVTGDFITWRYDEFARYSEILKPLADAAPTYAVLGNHDGGKWVGTSGYPDTEKVQTMLQAARIQLLHNRATELSVQGRPVELIGLGDLWAGELSSDSAFSERRSESGTGQRPISVVLAHNPDSKELLAKPTWDLMLSGHTHGGQIDLVFLGTPFAPVQDRNYVHGLRAWKDRWIHVSAGVGNLHGVRFNCRPEVSLLTVV